MLKGKELGDAIASAIQMKIDSGAAKSKAEIARHFMMKPPSLVDWVKKGSVAKDKLPELWRYFSDVAGPTHWGMTDSEWPSGLANKRVANHAGRSDAGDLSPSSNSPSASAEIHSNVLPGPDIRGRVPLISWVQAGVWSEAVDIYEPGYAEEWLPVFRNGSPHSYALRVQGDSMTAPHGKSYPEGTMIVVDPDQRSPSSGQRIIAKLVGTNAVTFKVFVEEDGRRWLKPLNPQHPPIIDEFRVLGTVVAKYEPE